MFARDKTSVAHRVYILEYFRRLDKATRHSALVFLVNVFVCFGLPILIYPPSEPEKIEPIERGSVGERLLDSGSAVRSASSPFSNVPEGSIVVTKEHPDHVIKGRSKHAQHPSHLAGTFVSSDISHRHSVISVVMIIFS